jgi:Flp pilus assembly protein TadD
MLDNLSKQWIPLLWLTWALFLPTGKGFADTAPGAQAVAQNNLGVGLMGRFEYQEAERVFARLAQRHPDWLDLRVNLAVAVLNRQLEGDEQRALALVDEVLARAQDHARAHYVAGLLRLYLGDPERAEAHFRAVLQADPEDGFAAYYLAQCLAQQSRFAPALAAYRDAIVHDAYLRSAYYGAFQAAQRLGERATARAYLTEYQRLARNPRARLAEFRYTRMGPKAEAAAFGAVEEKAPPLPAGAVFADRRALTALPTGTVAPGPASLTVADVQGDGLPDLFVAGGDARPRLLVGQPGGDFAPARGHPLTQVDGVQAALWGDFDNDGLTDVYFCRRGPNQLWRQSTPGRWQDVTASTGTAGGTSDTRDGAMFDADHDGDLDLFLVNADAPNELLNNNLDGSFRPLALERGIGGDGRASRTVLPVDLDGDRDADLIVLNREPPHEVYLNDRLWDYREPDDQPGFSAQPALAALAADLDADGREDLLTLSPDGRLLRWPLASGQTSSPIEVARLPGDQPRWGQLAVLDADGNGDLDLLAAWDRGWWVWDAQGRVLFRHDAALVGVAPLLLDPARGPGLLALSADGSLGLWPPGPGRFDGLALSLSGRTDGAATMRSNASGIGTRVALRVGSRWTLPPAYRSHSGPGQGLQPLALGLGGAPQADFVTLDWSDGVFQSELGLAAGRTHSISETQRQLSSCPVLFAWNGKEYAFATDFLGVGGIGYAVGPGEYAEPRPWENLQLSDELLRPRDGRLLLKITEPMEEAAYVDSVRLVAWDLPPGGRLVLDERMGIGDPQPSGAARFYRRERLALRATDRHGVNLTETLARADGRAAPLGALDHRFIGRLAEEQQLTLEFDAPLDQGPGEPLLVADGWVEYPYSQTMFAAWQAGAGFDAPSIEARDGEGRWRMLREQFGYPAGMPRRMSLPLGDLPPGTDALRIRGNMEVYWDRLAVVYAEPPTQARSKELPLLGARMARSGFPDWTYGAQRRPVLDYARRSPFRDTRHMPGFYTRFGPALELVQSRDDALAVIGPGEELHLEFAAPDSSPPRGWTRQYVLLTRGWAKDMDMFTRDGETLGPLPVSGMPAQRRDALHGRYNTRYRAGL